MSNQIERAAVLSRAELRHLLRVTDATSRYPERDAVVLLLGHCLGLRITEISQITVADLMQPSGAWRKEASVRAAISKGCQQRCVYPTNKTLLQAMDRYVEYRAKRGICATGESSYRGLHPHQPLIMSRRGGAYELNTKRRTLLGSGRKDYKAADALQTYVTRLYRRAGFKNASSHSGRRSLATKVLTKTGSMEMVSLILGHEGGIDVSMRYVDVSKSVLRQAFIDVL